MKRAIFGFLSGVVIASAANAAPIVNFVLKVDDANGTPTPGAWSLYATETGDAGIALMKVTLDNVNDPATAAQTTLQKNAARNGLIKAPKTTYDDGVGDQSPAGFTALRSTTVQGGTQFGNANLEFDGTQDTTNVNFTPIYGFGQTASSFSANNPFANGEGTSPTGSPWTSPLLLAQGTYSGVTPSFDAGSIANQANAFITSSDITTEAATIQKTVIAAPEPAAISMLAIAGVGLIRRRRTA